MYCGLRHESSVPLFGKYKKNTANSDGETDIYGMGYLRQRKKRIFLAAFVWLIKIKVLHLHSQKRKSDALLAQLVEQLTLNQWVQGSNP